MNLEAYLERIDYSGTTTADLETLRQLQRQHLLNVPFENLDIHYGREISLNADRLFEKIVEQKRGGFCYELNGLFYRLLREAGFDLRMISAQVSRDGGDFGPRFDHMALLVKLGIDYWLADVGFGRFAMEPLLFELDKEQDNNGSIFRISLYDKTHYLVEEKDKFGDYQPHYLFSTAPRAIGEFTRMCHYQQTSPDSHFTQKKVCSIATPNGRITLNDDKLTVTNEGKEDVTPIIGEKEFEEKLEEHFGIRMMQDSGAV